MQHSKRAPLGASRGGLVWQSAPAYCTLYSLVWQAADEICTLYSLVWQAADEISTVLVWFGRLLMKSLLSWFGLAGC